MLKLRDCDDHLFYLTVSEINAMVVYTDYMDEYSYQGVQTCHGHFWIEAFLSCSNYVHFGLTDNRCQVPKDLLKHVLETVDKELSTFQKLRLSSEKTLYYREGTLAGINQVSDSEYRLINKYGAQFAVYDHDISLEQLIRIVDLDIATTI